MERLFTHFACSNGNFLFFPPWYKYVQDPHACGTITINSLSDIWLIVAAIIEILLRVAALAAVGYIIFAGFQYLTSEGEPDKATKARETAINALIGLAIAILATALINFIAGSVH